MKLKPLSDRIVVRADEAEEKTASGIILPDTAKEKPQMGKILATGPGKINENGSLILASNDFVYFIATVEYIIWHKK